jgi:hypothetical protein
MGKSREYTFFSSAAQFSFGIHYQGNPSSNLLSVIVQMNRCTAFDNLIHQLLWINKTTLSETPKERENSLHYKPYQLMNLQMCGCSDFLSKNRGLLLPLEIQG